MNVNKRLFLACFCTFTSVGCSVSDESLKNIIEIIDVGEVSDKATSNGAESSPDKVAAEPLPLPIKEKEVKEEQEKKPGKPRRECYNIGEPTECCVTDTPTDCCESRFGDGLGGLLYKLGDHSGEPVILTPSICGHVQSVELVGPNGTIKARNAGMSNPDAGGICRDHHRFDIKALDLAKKLGTTKPRIRVNGSCFIEILKKGVKKRHD